MKNKRTFVEFLRMIYGISYAEYEELNSCQKKAVEIDYVNRYGSPIKWF